MDMAAFLEAREVERDDDAELSEDILRLWVGAEMSYFVFRR
jgi:hypothetical protein